MEICCQSIVENIMDYIDNELDDKTLNALEEHIHICPECKSFVDTYNKMLRMSGDLKNKKFVTPEIRERLKNLIKQKLKPN
ncbi:MAG: hypothetical protein GTO02_09105 [Candidatus Dadabacteria bacterium]|nr:hypothetical protein [Candidatus Dadabacteria bacterium]NIQ14539.1 hypothetical protein [Candidatus Dadabacteria bacterium]